MLPDTRLFTVESVLRLCVEAKCFSLYRYVYYLCEMREVNAKKSIFPTSEQRTTRGHNIAPLFFVIPVWVIGTQRKYKLLIQ